jgi:hypothetical protein
MKELRERRLEKGLDRISTGGAVLVERVST